MHEKRVIMRFVLKAWNFPGRFSNVFRLILDREPFDILRVTGFIDEKWICAGQTPLYEKTSIFKVAQILK